MSLSSHDGIIGKIILTAGAGEDTKSVVVASDVQPWQIVPPGIRDVLVNFPFCLNLTVTYNMILGLGVRQVSTAQHKIRLKVMLI